MKTRMVQRLILAEVGLLYQTSGLHFARRRCGLDKPLNHASFQ